MSSAKNPPASPSVLSIPFDRRSRRGSIGSISVASVVHKEQLAQALDKIHTSASQSDVLTTFNDFSAPPTAAPVTETKGSAGELVQQGLSGFYSRLKEAVVGGKAAPSEDSSTAGQDSAPAPAPSKAKTGTSTHTSSHTRSKSSVSSIPRGDGMNGGASSAVYSSNLSSELPTTASSTEGHLQQQPQSSKASSMTALSLPTSKSAQNSSSAAGQALPKLSRGEASASGGDPAGGTVFDMPRDLAKHANGYAGEDTKIPAVIDRLSMAGGLGGKRSPSVATDAGTAASSSISTSAHDSVYHESFAHDERPQQLQSGQMRIPGTTTNEGAPEIVSARLENMRKQVLSKDFWMADETCKDCFRCGDPFSAFRRKHHCRTCGWIFDGKCTSTISGQKFGVAGNLRVCKNCLEIINRRYDSGSEESDDPRLTTLLRSNTTSSTKPSPVSVAVSRAKSANDDGSSILERIADDEDDTRSTTTPMMAIPATRRKGDPSNRNSAILEIDAPQLSRPGSSRSLKSLNAARPPSSGHIRHHSKPNFHWAHAHSTHSTHGTHGTHVHKATMATPPMPPAEDRVPFRKDVADEMARKSKLPAFHDDNIIDPELAPYMSDESSGDEQMSIFATMASIANDMPPASLDPDRSNFGPFLGASSRKHRTRGEKSISGISFTSRGGPSTSNMNNTTNNNNGTGIGMGISIGMAGPDKDDTPHSARVQGRLRNMSSASITAGQHHLRSPRAKAGTAFKGPSLSSETLGLFDSLGGGGGNSFEGALSMRGPVTRTKQTKLSAPSLKHIKRMFRQLLNDAAVPNPAAWEKALIPLLRRCADDVDPNTREGDRMDIRHYVKLKKIPGGKPSDSSYVSGVIFTKNLALKSMPRRIAHPRILIVSFPIEYQRQQQHQFMSLEPVMSQEKEFLKMVVARIRNHQPEVVLAQRNVAGLALQSLAEAGIAVAYNVKASVIGAVSRCTGTPIISSMDMLSLPITVGRCAEFEVKTFVNNDLPGRKKTYIFLSGCEKFLGCTLALRGTSTALLSRMKHITEFMVYVVYNLKLESCLLSDAVVQMPAVTDGSGTTAKPVAARQPTNGSLPLATPASGGEKSLNSSERSPAASTMLLTDVDSVNTSLPDTGGPQTSQTPGQPTSQPPDEAAVAAPAEGNVPVEAASEQATEATGEGQPLPVALPVEPAQAQLLSQSTPSLLSLQDGDSQVLHLRTPHEDVPAPTFYSDMVEKYKTKILSASPFVKFTQPYLLVKAREQETRLIYLKKLRDQDIIEEGRDDEADNDRKGSQKQFQLINPEMVHEIGQKAPRQIMEVLHAVHDAEYDKALYAYQTMTRQWENYIQGNLDLFDPYSHQNIVVLYSLTCTETKIPCLEPGLIGIPFYDELPDPAGQMDADCTLGQYIQDLCDTAEELCHANGCDRPMWKHHRTYVHGEARVTFFVEPEAKLPSLPETHAGDESPVPGEDDEDTVYLWSYCKLCRRDLTVKPLSLSAWKYSFGKYLEMLFWSRGLRLAESTGCPHDYQKDHIRYFHVHGSSVRIHYDPIDLLEVVVPRARITWKVDHDLKLKNDIFGKTQERWLRFITSVKTRIKGIRIDSVLPDKEKDCRAEVERLAKKAHEEHIQVLRGLERAYMQSKHYEIIPLNATIRTMAEKIAEWDAAFAKFEADYLSDKDVRQLTVIQLRKMFTDTDSSSGSGSGSGSASAGTGSTLVASESGSKTPTSAGTTNQGSFAESDEKTSLPTSQPADGKSEDEKKKAEEQEGEVVVRSDQVVSLDLAAPLSPTMVQADLMPPTEATAAATTANQDEEEKPKKPEKPEKSEEPEEKAQKLQPKPLADKSDKEPPAIAVDPVPAAPAACPASALPVPSTPSTTSRSTSPSKSSRAGAPPLMSQQSLTEKVEQLRREFKAQSAEINNATQSLANPGNIDSNSSSSSNTQEAGPSQASSPSKSQARPIPEPRNAAVAAAQARKAGPLVSPPMVRAISQPVGVVPRLKHGGIKDAKAAFGDGAGSGTDPTSVVAGSAKVEKKFSDRIGLTALKNHRKAGQSAIPRFVHSGGGGGGGSSGSSTKRTAKKVTSLTQHFEQLSREFEKERNRERRQQAAKMHHPRAYVPKSSARATVEVYDNVYQAVQEPGPTDDEHLFASQHSEQLQNTRPPVPEAEPNREAAAAGDGRSAAVSLAPEPGPAAPRNTKETGATAGQQAPATAAQPETTGQDTDGQPSQTEVATEGETDHDHEHHHDHEHEQKDKSTAGSDDEEGGSSYADQSLEDILPDVETIAEHLEPSGTVPAELQQDKKSNLMKMLSNFWAERSASGWPELEYPLRPTDHIFIDSDVIVREDEPSSLIAFALSSEDYIAKLDDIWQQGRRADAPHGEEDDGDDEGGEEGGDEVDDENEETEERDGDADDESEENVEGGRGHGRGHERGDELAMKATSKTGKTSKTAEDPVPSEELPLEKQSLGKEEDGQPTGPAITGTGQDELQPKTSSHSDVDANPPPHAAIAPPMIAIDEEELERSLLRPTGTHLKYQFTEGSARMMCKIFYAEQFDALRRKCGVADRIIESLSRCLKWDSKGGKTKSVFLKTLDDRLVMKSLSPVETAAFLRFAPSYFRIMAEALFHDLPSVIAKMLGFFQVIVKNAATGTEIKLDLLIMENLFYDRQETRKFDLKGSMRNRKIQSTGEQNEVLLDENMVEYIYESPLFAREHAKKLLWASVWNDTLFLARQNVMDYSLMVAVDESRKELVVGIIDCIRTYTWDKKLESWIKDRGFAGGGRNRPTVTSPKEYKSRFREAMNRYILEAPNSWHLFGSMGYSHPSLLQRARFEDE
ncbi:Mitochondrial distribution and morphology protein 12 [Sporothrix curviconia]|uniref:1-phosphatidylinositol-3-phosphate 5-kinase n=1 Tax=Sporothrix curviconia TaxID=1260050 RepID=A0ABP0CZY2_9PEZI